MIQTLLFIDSFLRTESSGLLVRYSTASLRCISIRNSGCLGNQFPFIMYNGVYNYIHNYSHTIFDITNTEQAIQMHMPIRIPSSLVRLLLACMHVDSRSGHAIVRLWLQSPE